MIEKIIGTLEEARKLFGVVRTPVLVVNGKRFYKRIRGGSVDVSKLSRYVGKRVEVSYETTQTQFKDWVIDRLIFMGWGIPRTYSEIKDVSCI